jgi:hypothetical protein
MVGSIPEPSAPSWPLSAAARGYVGPVHPVRRLPGRYVPRLLTFPKRSVISGNTAPSFRRARTLSRAAGFILGQPRFYRTMESPARWAHFWVQGLLRGQTQKLFTGELPRESFFRKYQRGPRAKYQGRWFPSFYWDSKCAPLP